MGGGVNIGGEEGGGGLDNGTNELAVSVVRYSGVGAV